MADDKREKAKIFLASNMEQAYLTGFLTFYDVMKRIKTTLVAGLVTLTKLHGGKIIGPFYAHWRGEKKDTVLLFMEAFIGPQRFFEALLKNINADDLPKILEEMIESRVITWDNLVASFPYPQLMACLRESQERAEKAVPAETEEEVVIEEVMEIKKPSGDEK